MGTQFTGYERSNRCPEYRTKTCRNKICSNNWTVRTYTRISQRASQSSHRRIPKKMAQISTLAFLNYNTTYHSTLGCEPTRVFHNILDFILGYNPNPRYQPQTEVAEEITRRIAILHDQTKKNVMQSYLKYKTYYDKKAKAAPYNRELQLYF